MDISNGSTILTNIYTIIGIFFVAISAATLIGGIIAYKVAYKRGIKEIEQKATEIQERVINALQSEISSLQDRITGLEKENWKLSQTLGLIKAALRKRGLSVSIDGDLVTIHDAQGNTQTGRMSGDA